MSQCHSVQCAVITPDFESGGHAGFILVDNAVVGVRQCRGDNFFESVAVFTYAVNAGLYPGFLRRS